MRHKQINHARNVWDRAVIILPRANQFWYKYTYMEEMLGNVPGARQVRRGGGTHVHVHVHVHHVWLVDHGLCGVKGHVVPYPCN